MAPRKIDQVASKPKTEKKLRVRDEAKRVKAEIGKIKLVKKLKEETELIVKQTALTRMKLVLMFTILKARESGDLTEAANLTRFLREIVAMEKANAILDEVKNDDEDP